MIGEDSPTGKTLIAINDEKFQAAGAKDYRDKIVLAEALHNLKFVDRARFDTLLKAAKNDRDYMDWARESYERAKGEGERRPFNAWHERSRFDQVLAGYVFAGDPSIPTMKGWRRKELPVGDKLRAQLEQLRADLGVE